MCSVVVKGPAHLEAAPFLAPVVSTFSARFAVDTLQCHLDTYIECSIRFTLTVVTLSPLLCSKHAISISSNQGIWIPNLLAAPLMTGLPWRLTIRGNVGPRFKKKTASCTLSCKASFRANCTWLRWVPVSHICRHEMTQCIFQDAVSVLSLAI